MEKAAAREFREFFDVRGDRLRITSNPLEYGTQKRSIAFLRLKKLQQAFLDRLREEAGQQLLDFGDD